jgi:hypothetical protein
MREHKTGCSLGFLFKPMLWTMEAWINIVWANPCHAMTTHFQSVSERVTPTDAMGKAIPQMICLVTGPDCYQIETSQPVCCGTELLSMPSSQTVQSRLTGVQYHDHIAHSILFNFQSRMWGSAGRSTLSLYWCLPVWSVDQSLLMCNNFFSIFGITI